MPNSKNATSKTYQVGLLDSTHNHTPKTFLRSQHLLNTALDKVISHSERKNINLDLFENILNQLAKFDPKQSQIVELKFFGGLSSEQTAKTLGLSLATVKLEWQIAKMWLYNELRRYS